MALGGCPRKVAITKWLIRGTRAAKVRGEQGLVQDLPALLEGSDSRGPFWVTVPLLYSNDACDVATREQGMPSILVLHPCYSVASGSHFVSFSVSAASHSSSSALHGPPSFGISQTKS